MDKLKQIAQGIVLTVALSSSGKALAQTFSNDGENLRNKVETDINTDISNNTVFNDDRAINTTAFDSHQAAENKPHKIAIDAVCSRPQANVINYSDGSVARITYGYVNGSSQETPIKVSLKRAGEKSITFATVVDEYTAGADVATQGYSSIKRSVEDLIFAKEHDLDNYSDLSPENEAILKKALTENLDKASTELAKISSFKNSFTNESPSQKAIIKSKHRDR